MVQDRGVLQQSARANGKLEDVLEMVRCAGGCEAGARFGFRVLWRRRAYTLGIKLGGT